MQTYFLFKDKICIFHSAFKFITFNGQFVKKSTKSEPKDPSINNAETQRKKYPKLWLGISRTYLYPKISI
jgi:hypothetical protein